MTIPPYARLAAKLLQREYEPARAAQPSATARADAVAAVEQALVRRARRRQLQKISYAAVTCTAAAACLAWVVPQLLSPTSGAERAPLVAAGGAAHPILVHAFGQGAQVVGARSDRQIAHAGERVRTPVGGGALLAFKTGTRLTLEGSAELTLVEHGASEVLALDRGALRASVAKLTSGQRFIVHTLDTEVEVHGTSFRVTVDRASDDCAASSHTQVEVFEGVVSVRHGGVEYRITKGEHWPQACARTKASSERASPSANIQQPSAADPEAGPGHVAMQATRTRTLSSAQSSLSRQNDAFAAAVAARQAGDYAGAARGFEKLLSQFPSSPLRESAAVQRMQVVHRFDRRRAHALAREYLNDYPDGFAREQATAILAELP